MKLNIDTYAQMDIFYIVCFILFYQYGCDKIWQTITLANNENN